MLNASPVLLSRRCVFTRAKDFEWWLHERVCEPCYRDRCAMYCHLYTVRIHMNSLGSRSQAHFYSETQIPQIIRTMGTFYTLLYRWFEHSTLVCISTVDGCNAGNRDNYSTEQYADTFRLCHAVPDVECVDSTSFLSRRSRFDLTQVVW